jgi:hypothetical protein
MDAGEPARAIAEGWDAPVRAFETMRSQYLLY